MYVYIYIYICVYTHINTLLYHVGKCGGTAIVHCARAVCKFGGNQTCLEKDIQRWVGPIDQVPITMCVTLALYACKHLGRI